MKERKGGGDKPNQKPAIESNAHQKKQVEPQKRKAPKRLRVSITDQKITVSGVNMTEAELELLYHPEKWPHGVQLPVLRRGGNPVRNKKDAGIVMADDLCRVWTDIYLGDRNPREGEPVEYESPEALLSEWEID
jgi:hypothetical protein